MDWTVLDRTEALRTNIITVLPAYIAFDTISDITIELENPDGTTYATCAEVTPTSYACPSDRNGICGPTDPWSAAGDLACNGTGANCCFMYNTANRSLVVAHTTAIQANTAANFDSNGNILSAKITYTAPGTLLWEQNKTSATTVDDTSVIDHRRSSTPGNAMYYLKRLAKLEYLGIPQMTYEPIYCNDNYQKLVPGIFHETAFGQALNNVNDFINHGRTFIDSGVSKPWASDTAAAPQNADSLNINLVAGQELVDHNALFSDNKFLCCLELNTPTNNAGSCCTGYAADDDGNTTADPDSLNLKCKIPNETNLNVYFNKFVSGEGMKDFDGGVPLTTDDFDAKTGEPKTSTTVINKLIALGQAFCASGTTRRGGIFGNFQAKPYGPLRQPVSGNDGDTLFTIVDDPSDNGSINNRVTGFQMYNLGYKWNHHVYCDGTGN
jgi:hypothetical protein